MNKKLRECPKCKSDLFVGGERGETGLFYFCTLISCNYKKRKHSPEEKIVELEREVEKLQEESDSLNQEMRNMDDNLSEKEDEIKRLNKELNSETHKKIEQLEESRDEMRAELRDKDDEAEDLEKENSKMNDEHIRLVKESLDKSNVIKELKAKNEDMEKRVESDMDSLDYHIEYLNKLHRTLGHNSIRSEIDDLIKYSKNIRKILTDKEG